MKFSTALVVLLCFAVSSARGQSYPHLTVATGGTVTTANTYQVILASNGGRNGCLIQNTSTAVEYLSTLATPANATSIQLAAGAFFNCRVGDLVISDQLSITSATAASSFVVWAQ